MEFKIREYKPGDIAAILQLFKETVHTVNAKDYTPEQLNAWAPEQLDEEKWQHSLNKNYTVVAEHKRLIVGFADIDNTGYFDHLFVHKDYQGRGVAKLLANTVENYAEHNSYSPITVAASITARPFFLKRGYEVLKEQKVERLGQVLTNYLMKKA